MFRRTVLALTFALSAFAAGSEELRWGDPVVFSQSARFVQTASSDAFAVVVWQEFTSDAQTAAQGRYYFSLQRSSDGLTWTPSPRFLGPYPYTDKDKLYRKYSVIIDRYGKILIAVPTDDHTVSVFISSDRGSTFVAGARLSAPETVNVPFFSLSAKREILLFVTYLLKDEEGIYIARSANGNEWSGLTPFIESGLVQPGLPHHAVFNGKDCVVFQARRSKPTEFQLFLKTSADGGKTWSASLPLTETMGVIDGETVPEAQIISRISNQRPFLLATKNELLVAWERSRTVPLRPPQAYLMSLNEKGRAQDAAGQLKPEIRLSSGTGTVYNPQLLTYKENVYALWFEKQTGSSTDDVFFLSIDEAEKSRRLFNMSAAVGGDSLFPQPVVFKGILSIIWENQLSAQGKTEERLFILGPDRFVAPPNLTALTFNDREVGRLSRLRFRWSAVNDSSGIKEYRYLVSRQPTAGVKDAQIVPDGVLSATVDIDADGTWYVSVFAIDGAGNVSAPAQLVYTRDTMPPGKVRFTSPEPDADGFLPSNTVRITWAPPDNEAIAGYSYRLKRIAEDPTAATASYAVYPTPEDAPSLSEPQLDFTNLENGVWALAVCAFDKAGNRGEAETLIFRLRRYQAETRIITVNAERDASGRLVASIYGRGFLEGGSVEAVYLDRDGTPPFDYEFRTGPGGFTVAGNRLITGIPLDNVKEGVYEVGVRHPVRGVVFSGGQKLSVEATGVVKYGDFTAPPPPAVRFVRSILSLSFTDIMVWLIVLSSAALFVFAGRKAFALVREAASLRGEVTVFVQGGTLPMKEAKKKVESFRRKGIGLRLKFTLLISLLALLIVVIVALPISVSMIRIQQRSLARKLNDEVNIVLSGIVDGTKTYLFLNNRLLVSENLEKQYKQLPQSAEYAIVTGPRFINPKTGETDPSGTDRIDVSSMERVWAVQPPDLSVPVRSGVFTPLESEIADAVSPLIPGLEKKINDEARERAADLDREIDELVAERDRILFRTDRASINRKASLDARIKENIKQRDGELHKIARSFEGSVPPFRQDDLDLSVPSYLFYMPVVTRVPGYDRYYWGTARLAVSTADIARQIEASTRTLLGLTGGIALVALGLGVAGALILASIIITPLRRLSRGVAVIRDTQDKSLLKDHIIDIRTRDELRDLADTVNQMTQGLVKAALANKELMIGQEVQKMFIPLETSPSGKKRTTGALSTDHIEIFGYYEGAKVVSGDYFDFKKLDDRHFAVIKCDVAGKGVAGSLIMIEVATLFIAYFKDWSLKKDGLRIERLVYQINDMLEERGFTGRFAALSLCLIDSLTGTCYACHAGDKELHFYRSSLGGCRTIELANTPAAGVFHSSMIPPQSGFRVEKQKLDTGDTLFLFTDGLEESKRIFRDGSFAPTVCTEPGLKEGESHGGTHVVGKESEELSMKRITAIIETVFGRGTYRLMKYHNPFADEELLFDFSDCRGTAEDAVLALAAVEKIFRLYPDRSAPGTDAVRVDRKIDEFLKKTFSAYRYYFHDQQERPDEPDYVFYPGLKEDEQYDDLTILAIRRK